MGELEAHTHMRGEKLTISFCFSSRLGYYIMCDIHYYIINFTHVHTHIVVGLLNNDPHPSNTLDDLLACMLQGLQALAKHTCTTDNLQGQ